MLLNRGVEPAKVMMLAGFADLKTLGIYMRKTGIMIKGATKALDDFMT
jgi:integrase